MPEPRLSASVLAIVDLPAPGMPQSKSRQLREGLCGSGAADGLTLIQEREANPRGSKARGLQPSCKRAESVFEGGIDESKFVSIGFQLGLCLPSGSQASQPMPSAGGYRKPALSDRRLNVSGKQLDGLRGKWKFLREDNEELNLRSVSCVCVHPGAPSWSHPVASWPPLFTVLQKLVQIRQQGFACFHRHVSWRSKAAEHPGCESQI